MPSGNYIFNDNHCCDNVSFNPSSIKVSLSLCLWSCNH